MVDRVRPDCPPVAAQRDDEHLDVDEGTVLAHTPGDAMRCSLRGRLLHDRDALLRERFGPEDEVFDRPPERLSLRESEQRLSGWVPGRHTLFEVESDDRDRADLEQGFQVLLLTSQLFVAPVERILQLFPVGDVEQKAVMGHRPTRLVPHHARLVEEPADTPVARDHSVFHREQIARLARAPVLGEDAFPVVRMDDLQEVLWVRSPLFGRVSEHGLELRAHVDVGADVVEPVDVDRDRDLLDQRAERGGVVKRTRASVCVTHRRAPAMSRQPPRWNGKDQLRAKARRPKGPRDARPRPPEVGRPRPPTP